MPLQGHWDRVNTPLREVGGRERRTVWIVAGLLAAGAIAAIIVAIATSSPPIPAGCIQVEVPSTMGAGTSRFCGGAAADFCRSEAANSPPLNATALPKCRQAGYRSGAGS